jgi:hypothetical protein
MLTNSTYAQFLSAFDTERGRMHMEFLRAQVPHPKEIIDYKMSTLDFDDKKIHPSNQMDLHRQTGQMVFSTLASFSTTVAKLQVSMNNVQTQLNLEMVSSFAKDQRIKSLEEFLLTIGYDPSNVKVVEELLKKMNADITSLKKKLKLSATEDSQTKEMAKTKGQT